MLWRAEPILRGLSSGQWPLVLVFFVLLSFFQKKVRKSFFPSFWCAVSFVDVSLSVAVERSFTYGVPAALTGDVAIGKRVLVPFGKRVLTGYVTGLSGSSDLEKVRDIIDVLDAEPLFDEVGMRFFRFLSSYYLVPLGQVLSLIHPPGSGVCGKRFFRLVPGGPLGQDLPRGLAGEVLGFIGESGGSAALSALLRRFRGRALYSVLSRLVREGFLLEDQRLSGGAGRTEKIVSPVREGKDSDISIPDERTPAQKRVYEYLRSHGRTLLRDMKKDLGGSVFPIVKKLAARGLVEVEERAFHADPMEAVMPRGAAHRPNKEQEAAIGEVIKALEKKSFSPFLLYGVTGSGKTLVYLELMEEVVRGGGSALMLVPEIALTAWAAEYLKEKFGGLVAVYHSGLTPSARLGQWGRIQRGEARVIVGARSALFAPIRDLSLIIVDEEHDPSYKQEDGVRYNGRDAALMLGKFRNIPVVLGSATPSVESFHNARAGRLRILRLEKRVEERPMPEVEIVDMRGTGGAIISERLGELLEETFRAGNQALLFLNRRGFSGCLVCRDCGHAFACRNCSVTLTFHKGAARLRCHYCDFSVKAPEACPECEGTHLRDPGTGTERVEEEVRRLFPGKTVLRMDSDTTRKRGALRAMMEAMESGEAHVLVGTQMVSKGHHFPGITLVGIISGDTSLNIPDFRSPERTFQLVTQAAGRAGRGETPGRVVIQTLNPWHYALRRAAGHDYEGFFEEEIRVRKELGYPPFSRLAVMRLEAPEEGVVVRACKVLGREAGRLLPRFSGSVTCLGPSPALVPRVRGTYRFQMLVKGESPKVLHDFVACLSRAFSENHPGRRVRLSLEMDPVTTV